MKANAIKTLISAILLLMIADIINAQLMFLFQKTYGVTDNDNAACVCPTDDGGYIITGFTSDAGWTDACLIKTDYTGDTLWTRSFGGISFDNGVDVEETADGGYSSCGNTGSFGAGGNDPYIIKTDINGDTLWTKTFGGSGYDDTREIHQTADGGYIFTGHTLSYGAGAEDILLVRIDPNGDLVWTKTFGGANIERANSVQIADNGFIITGHAYSFGAGGGDVYLIRTDSNGDTLWTRAFGGSAFDNGSCVQQTSDGGFAVAGTTFSFGATNGNIYVIRTDANGDTLWTRTYGGTNADFGISIRETGSGAFIIAGSTTSFGAGNTDAYLIFIDPDGNHIWSMTYGGTENDNLSSVRKHLDGGFILCGTSHSFTTGGTCMFPPCSEMYLIKTDPLGYSNCNELPANTIVTAPATIVSTTATITGSGGNQNNTETIFKNPAIYDSTLCFEVIGAIAEMSNDNELNIYPNPSDQIITISINNPLNQDMEIKIFNSFGKLVNNISDFNSNEISLNTRKLANGIYFIQVRKGRNKVAAGKFIIN